MQRSDGLICYSLITGANKWLDLPMQNFAKDGRPKRKYLFCVRVKAKGKVLVNPVEEEEWKRGSLRFQKKKKRNKKIQKEEGQRTWRFTVKEKGRKEGGSRPANDRGS